MRSPPRVTHVDERERIVYLSSSSRRGDPEHRTRSSTACSSRDGEPLSGDTLEISNPGRASWSARVHRRDGARTSTARCGPRTRRSEDWAPARLRRPRRRSCTRARRPSRRTSTSSRRSSSPSRARRSARPRSSCTRPPTRSSTTRAWRAGRAALGPQRRPRRRRRACCAARSAWSRRSCRGTSRRRCCATSSARRCCRGNTVVAKPADTTPFTTLRLAEIFHEAGLPAGVFNVVPGTGAVAGEALVTHPLRAQGRLHGLDAGRRARRTRWRRAGSKRVTLELGGSDPMIICDDADLKAAASAAAMGRFYNCGQACLAIKRLYVFESVADEVIEAVAAKAERLRVGIGATTPDASSARCTPQRQRDDHGAPDRRVRGRDRWPAAARPDGPGRRLVPRADRGRRARPRLADGARGGLRARRCRSGA